MAKEENAKEIEDSVRRSAGVVLYANCFGVASSIGNQPQAMANLYGMNVLTESYGQIVASVYDMTPTIPSTANPRKYTSNGGYWNVAKPAPKPCAP